MKVDRAGKNFTAQARKTEKCDAWKRDIVEMVSRVILPTRDKVDKKVEAHCSEIFLGFSFLSLM